MLNLLGQIDVLDQQELDVMHSNSPQCDELNPQNESSIPLVINEEHVVYSNLDQKYKDMIVKDKYKVVFLANEGGEENYSAQFKFSAERIGWEVKVYPQKTSWFDQEILEFNPDFILFTLLSNMRGALNEQLMLHPSKKYFILHGIVEALLGWIMTPSEAAGDAMNSEVGQCINQCDGMISLPKDAWIYEKLFTKINKNLFILDTLPFTPALVNEPAEPEYLTWCNMGWDKLRSSHVFKEFITELSRTIPMKVYGPSGKFDFLAPGVYSGYTPAGIPHIETIRQNGIYLLTHASMYLDTGTPTSRLFEALAANVIIISDMHPFAIKHFGDNILYFDQYADSKTIYGQIKSHYDWIKANPEQAKAKAGRAHNIYIENFTIEKDLPRIAKMHEFVMMQKGKKN